MFISSDVAVMSDGSVHVLNTMIYFRNELKVSIFLCPFKGGCKIVKYIGLILNLPEVSVICELKLYGSMEDTFEVGIAIIETSRKGSEISEPFAKASEISETFAKAFEISEPFAKASEISETFAKASEILEIFANGSEISELFANASEISEPFSNKGCGISVPLLSGQNA